MDHNKCGESIAIKRHISLGKITLNQNHRPFSLILFYMFCLAPLFVVSVHWWTGFIVIVGSLIAMGYLLTWKIMPPPSSLDMPVLKLSFIGPTLAVLFSSVLRSDMVASQFDGPLRFVLALAIFSYVIKIHENPFLILQYVLPFGLIITSLLQILLPPPDWGGRFGTYFADPLVLAYTSIAMGLMSLISINGQGRDSNFLIVLKIIGFLAACFLVVRSGSRTGLIAFPVVLFLWVYSKLRACSTSAKVVLAFGVVVGFLILISIFSDRVWMMIAEFLGYSWSGIAPDSSIGMRITFLRIAVDLFSGSPFAGYGDTAMQTIAVPASVYAYASPEALRMAFFAGFHNEVVSNAIRYGFFGGLAALALLLVPLWFFVKNIYSDNLIRKSNSLLGGVFVFVFFVASFSTEVFDLKYMASFYAIVVALLLGSVVAQPLGK